ncbi:MAG: RNA polymerase sigma factor [Opitutaceae bacterium]
MKERKEDPDLELLEAIRAGDGSALETLMERHQVPLYYFVLRYAGEEHLARDIVQESFVRAYFRAGPFRPRSTVKTWLFKIALNLCRDAGRRRTRAPEFVSLDQTSPASTPSLDIADDTPVADEQAASSDDLSQLHEAINLLPDKLKLPLILCTLEQRTQKEAAELLSTTPKTVELRIHRAKKRLQKMLAHLETVPN